MAIKKLASGLYFLFTLCIVLNPLIAGKLYAASGTISVIPQNGNYKNGDVFTASIKIDGGGTAFNAAKATISFSDSLKIERLTLGDCGFAYVLTPTATSLSFAGVILGGSKSSCTAYSLSLRVIGENNGSINISNGSLKSYKGANEILDRVASSSYTFTGSGNVQTANNAIPVSQSPVDPSTGEKKFNLVYTIEADSSKGKDLKVIIDPGYPTQVQAPVSSNPLDNSLFTAVLDNIPSGVHTIVVKDKDRIVSTEVVNVDGDNREIKLGVNTESGNINIMLYIALGIMFVIAISVVGYIFYRRKKQHLMPPAV